jgi:DNA-binding response OmpR family regulator
VRQNSGYIAVASAPEDGTRIVIYLPLFDGEPDQGEPVSDGVPRGGHETILVVEDQPEVLSLIERILTHHGYRALCARSAREAGQIAREPTQRLDLLLCDVVLADESGIALAQSLLRDRPELPVLWISGYAADVIEAHGVSGPIDLLNKPFSATELAARVRAALERRAGLRAKM